MSRLTGRPPLFYGWRIVAVAALAMVGTLPGRTQGLGLVTEPLLADFSDLGLDRLSFAEINLWATVLGSAGAIGVGRVLDRIGSRVTLTAIAVLLGLVVAAMSQVSSIAALTPWLVLTRALGQSALSVVSLAMIGPWFIRRIDTAMAVFSVTMSVGFMIAFPVVGSIVQGAGWRMAWLTIGVALLAVLAPIAWIVVRRGPESIGARPDDDAAPEARPDAHARAADGYTWNAALATPAFWAFAMAAALYGLVASGIGLFNESILQERGFGPGVYYQTLVVTALTALAGNFLGGWLATRVRLTALLAIAQLALAVGLAVLPHVSTVLHVMLWASAMGIGGGLVMVLFFSVWPRVFGRRHLGRIQGAAQALTVLASAIGPLLLAWYVDRTGSYAAAFRMLAVLVAAVGATALFVRLPAPAGSPAS